MEPQQSSCARGVARLTELLLPHSPSPLRFNNLTTDAFSFRLEYNTSARHGLPPGHVGGPVIAAYDIDGVKGAIER